MYVCQYMLIAFFLYYPLSPPTYLPAHPLYLSYPLSHFTTLCYSADGQCILGGGRSKYVCLYDVEHQVLLKRFQTSSNESFEGMKVSEDEIGFQILIT